MAGQSKWIWMPHAGHLIVSSDCRFHLNTGVGHWLVSTIGEYVPDSAVREILAKSRGIDLEGRGDARKASWMHLNGFEEIGAGRKYETLVFPAEDAQDGCCPVRAADWSEVDRDGYNDPDEAYKGHIKMCIRWARKGKKAVDRGDSAV